MRIGIFAISLLIFCSATCFVVRATTLVLPPEAIRDAFEVDQHTFAARWKGIEIPDGTFPVEKGYYSIYRHENLTYLFGPTGPKTAAERYFHDLVQLRDNLIRQDSKFSNSSLELIEIDWSRSQAEQSGGKGSGQLSPGSGGSNEIIPGVRTVTPDPADTPGSGQIPTGSPPSTEAIGNPPAITPRQPTASTGSTPSSTPPGGNIPTGNVSGGTQSLPGMNPTTPSSPIHSPGSTPTNVPGTSPQSRSTPGTNTPNTGSSGQSDSMGSGTGSGTGISPSAGTGAKQSGSPSANTSHTPNAGSSNSTYHSTPSGSRSVRSGQPVPFPFTSGSSSTGGSGSDGKEHVGTNPTHGNGNPGSDTQGPGSGSATGQDRQYPNHGMLQGTTGNSGTGGSTSSGSAAGNTGAGGQQNAGTVGSGHQNTGTRSSGTASGSATAGANAGSGQSSGTSSRTPSSNSAWVSSSTGAEPVDTAERQPGNGLESSGQGNTGAASDGSSGSVIPGSGSTSSGSGSGTATGSGSGGGSGGSSSGQQGIGTSGSGGRPSGDGTQGSGDIPGADSGDDGAGGQPGGNYSPTFTSGSGGGSSDGGDDFSENNTSGNATGLSSGGTGDGDGSSASATGTETSDSGTAGTGSNDDAPGTQQAGDAFGSSMTGGDPASDSGTYNYSPEMIASMERIYKEFISTRSRPPFVQLSPRDKTAINGLADREFFEMYPELNSRPLTGSEENFEELSEEWLAIREKYEEEVWRNTLADELYRIQTVDDMPPAPFPIDPGNAEQAEYVEIWNQAREEIDSVLDSAAPDATEETAPSDEAAPDEETDEQSLEAATSLDPEVESAISSLSPIEAQKLYESLRSAEEQDATENIAAVFDDLAARKREAARILQEAVTLTESSDGNTTLVAEYDQSMDTVDEYMDASILGMARGMTKVAAAALPVTSMAAQAGEAIQGVKQNLESEDYVNVPTAVAYSKILAGVGAPPPVVLTGANAGLYGKTYANQAIESAKQSNYVTAAIYAGKTANLFNVSKSSTAIDGALDTVEAGYHLKQALDIKDYQTRSKAHAIGQFENNAQRLLDKAREDEERARSIRSGGGVQNDQVIQYLQKKHPNLTADDSE